MLPLLLALGLTTSAVPPTAAPIQATAVLTTPHDIMINWHDPAPGAAGHVVEWGTSPNDEFVVLGFLPPAQAAFKHPDLMPDTMCYYQVRPYYGPASAEVEISLPKELSDAAYVAAFAKPEDYHWAVPEIRPEPNAVRKLSIREAATANDAGPTNFKIALVSTTVSGMKLTWTDRANDEDGFMIEMKPEGSADFQVVALVKPDVNAFGWAFNPPVRRAKFRVRAYYYGASSPLVSQRTGPEEPAAKKS